MRGGFGLLFLDGLTDEVGLVPLEVGLTLASFMLAVEEGVIWASLAFVIMKKISPFAVASAIILLGVLSAFFGGSKGNGPG